MYMNTYTVTGKYAVMSPDGNKKSNTKIALKYLSEEAIVFVRSEFYLFPCFDHIKVLEWRQWFVIVFRLNIGVRETLE